METAPVENSHSASPPGKNGHHLENSVPDPQHDSEMEPNHEISEEEGTSIMEVIAATGKFWHHWDMLRSLLSSRLKQDPNFCALKVLAEYPEAQTVEDMIGPQQSSLSGETYPELVKRLDEALLTFVEGPPFTLQRLCENGKEKKDTTEETRLCLLALIPRQLVLSVQNLLVTSTLTMSTDPYPLSTSHKAVEQEKESDKPEAQPNPTENGTEAMSNGDEEMVDAEVEEEKMHENESKGMETKDEMMAPANEVIKTSPEPVSIAKPADLSPSSEQLNQTSS
ncbi:hypothetical protein ACLOJK_008654 [Asimina triloba]